MSDLMKTNRAIDALLVVICILNVILLILLAAIGRFSEAKIAGMLSALGILIGCGALLIRRRRARSPRES